MKSTIDVKFNIFDLIFQPYKEQSGTLGSFNILKSCIRKVNNERTKNQRFLIIDRHETRDKAESRRLFISSAAYLPREKMFKCKINLFRDKAPSFLDKQKMTISSTIDLKNRELVETTNFYIDVPEDGNLLVSVYDVNGRLVNELINTQVVAGRIRGRWSGKNSYGVMSPTGIYFLKVETGANYHVQKLALVK